MALGSMLLAGLGIGFLIFIHEFGHFLAARAAGVHVEVFSLGFGPRLAGFVWRGTDFRLSAVPFGGYVMVAGQDPSDRRYPRSQSLYSKSVGRRAVFWSGGVIMNALFALIVFPIVFSAGVRFAAPVAGFVPTGSAAWEAGIEPGERILEVAGKEIYSFQNLRVEVALHGNRPVQLLIEGEDQQRRVVTAQPHYDKEVGLYGLGLQPAADLAPPEVIVEAGGPAAQAGVVTGDRLLRIGGEQPAYFGSFGMDAVPLLIERDGEQIEITVSPTPTTKDQPLLIGVVSLPNRVAGMRPGSPLLARLGLQRDDRVLAIDDRPFLSGKLADFETGPSTTDWLVLRDGAEHHLKAEASADERRSLKDHLALAGDFRLQLQPTDGGAAQLAGILPGDWVEAIDGVEVDDWEQLRDIVKEAGAKPLQLRLLRPDEQRVTAGLAAPTGTVVELTLEPRVQPVPTLGLNIPLVPRMVEIRAESFGEALSLGTVCSLDLVKQLYVTLKRLITGEVGAKNLGGIIKISQISYQAAQRGPSWFWYLMALLSLNLAFVNLLPIPVLDGGHLLFLLIEKVKGSPVSSRVLGYSQVIGLVFVLLLVVFVTYNDILGLL